jgi:predicted nucleic acid-binding Zn ribbon protein
MTKCKFCSRPVRSSMSLVCGDVCAELLKDEEEKKRERDLPTKTRQNIPE